MNRRHLYLLSGFLTAVGLVLFLYKILALDFPLIPETRTYVWDIEAHLTFEAGDTPVKIAMHIPRNSRRFAIVNENFISRGYGVEVSSEEGRRKVIWISSQPGRTKRYRLNRICTVPIARHPRRLYPRFAKNLQIRTAWWQDY